MANYELLFRILVYFSFIYCDMRTTLLDSGWHLDECSCCTNFCRILVLCLFNYQTKKKMVGISELLNIMAIESEISNGVSYAAEMAFKLYGALNVIQDISSVTISDRRDSPVIQISYVEAFFCS